MTRIRFASVGALTGCTPAGLAIAVGLAVTSAFLVNAYRPTRAWKHLMWEGGLLEWLTALSFALAGGLFLRLAMTRVEGKGKGARYAVLGVGCLILAGEELNWGQGMLVLDLDDPAFETRYNPQGGTLHSSVHPLVPVLGLIAGAGGLRLAAPWSLRFVPLPLGFLNAVLVTALSIPFMNLDGDHFLFLDEVVEWSTSILLLCLALHDQRGWFFLRPWQSPS